MFKKAKKLTGAKRFEKRTLPPLDAQKLVDLAYWYTGKYAVSVQKARMYLTQKLKMRGWAGPEDAEKSAADVLEDVLARLVEYGAVNDALVASSAVAGARRKGLAGMRVRMALSAKQVSGEAAEAALASPDESDGTVGEDDEGEEVPGLAAAQRFARRKRLGEFRNLPLTPERRKKEISALIRAGHSFVLAAMVVDGEE
jgi:regulatory protein